MKCLKAVKQLAQLTDTANGTSRYSPGPPTHWPKDIAPATLLLSTSGSLSLNQGMSLSSHLNWPTGTMWNGITPFLKHFLHLASKTPAPWCSFSLTGHHFSVSSAGSPSPLRSHLGTQPVSWLSHHLWLLAVPNLTCPNPDFSLNFRLD